jgi:hypothetical protein
MAPPTTYADRNIAKTVASHFIAGSGDAASAASAEFKAQMLSDILQEYYQDRGYVFDDTDIGQTEVKKAIAYARGKKHSKAMRKGVIATTKFGLQIALVVGGASIGSIVPVAGTALGAVGGAVAGASLGVTVSLADQIKRKSKGLYKYLRNTRGEHRKQAAATLMHCSDALYNRQDGGNPARDALIVILGEEFDKVMAAEDVGRIADRLKSN